LAIAVGAHAAARAVAQGLGAVHRTRHAGGGEHALAAHAAVVQRALDGLLDGRHGPLDALIAERTEQPVHAHQHRLEAAIECVQAARVAHRPEPDRIHQEISAGGAEPDALRFSSSPLARISRSRSSSVYCASSRAASAAASTARSSPQGRGALRCQSARYASELPLPARIAARSTASWKRCESCTLAVSRPRLTMTCAGISRQEMTVSEPM